MKFIALFLAIITVACATLDKTTTATNPPPGKQIAFNRDKGNCLACHEIEDGEFPGNIGPALKNLPSHFKDKQQLREQIWDATQFNPSTSMPPFGKNKILTEKEIDQLVDYLWGL